MLDLGFEPQLKAIASQIRPDRHTLLFSATWPEEVKQLAADLIKDEYTLIVGPKESNANSNIRQVVQQLDQENKL